MTEEMGGVTVSMDEEYVGYAAAGSYLGLKRSTLSHYVNNGIGPEPEPERRVVNGSAMRVFRRSKMDAWQAGRGCRGKRVDLDMPDRVRGFAAAARRLGMPTLKLQKLIKDGMGPAVTWVPGIPPSEKVWPEFLFSDLDAWAEAWALEQSAAAPAA